MEGTAGASKPKRRTEKDLMLENGGAGVYSQARTWMDGGVGRECG